MSSNETDGLSWAARRALRATVPSGANADGSSERRVAALHERLRAAGVRGNFANGTLYARGIPAGCRPCLAGRGTNLYLTGLCTRDCFFCFNQKPRRDETVVHGVPVSDPAEAAALVGRGGLRSVGISGGEPLLFPERAVAIVRALKSSPRPPRVDLYTNGDRATAGVLRALKDAGLDSIRIDAAARDYDLSPVRLALEIFDEVSVEIPVIPADAAKLRSTALELDRLGASHLILHELFVCADNRDRARERGAEALGGEQPAGLTWRPATGALEPCLELLLFAAERCRRLGVYLCSCGTQESIARNGLRRRRKAARSDEAGGSPVGLLH